MKLDLGCGPNKRPDFYGVDILPAFNGKPAEECGVDLVFDLRTTPWPWESDSVEEAFSSHFVEHLTGTERVGFFNELCRVMQKGARALIVTPHWSHACAYGDPTHQWPPMSEWYAYYLNAEWRKVNAPHAPYTCDFDFMVGGSWDPWLQTRNPEFQQEKMQHNINSFRDLHVTLTKR